MKNVVEIITKMANKASVSHSIFHRVLLEYLTHANDASLQVGIMATHCLAAALPPVLKYQRDHRKLSSS